MDIGKKVEIVMRLRDLMIEHKQDILCPSSHKLISKTLTLIEIYEERGLSIEIRGATSGVGFFELDLCVAFKK